MKYNGPKVRRARRIGVAITEKDRRILERSGARARGRRRNRAGRRPSDYALQLLEKQRLRFQYNVSERQLAGYYRRASRQAGATPLALLRMLSC